MLKLHFVLFLFLFSSLITPLSASNDNPPPKDFKYVSFIAKMILQKNHSRLNLPYFRDEFIEIFYSKTTKYNEYECIINISGQYSERAEYCKYIWIGYSGKHDLYYVDTVPIPEKRDFLEKSTHLYKVFLGRGSRTRLWESDKRWRKIQW